MTRYRNTVSLEGQEKISYEDEMIEKDHSQYSDSDEEFVYFNKNDAPREDSNKFSNKQSKSKKNKDQSPNCKESPSSQHDQDSTTLVKNETEAEDQYLKNEYAEFTPPQPCSSESQKLDLTKMMASDQIGETMRVAGQRGVEYMRQFNTTYGDHQYLSAAASMNSYPNSIGNLIAAPMNSMFPYAGNNTHNMAVKNQKMINYLMSSQDRPVYSQIFPSKEAVTDLNNPPVHNNRDLGRSPNFINQNSLYFDRQVLTSSSINNEKQRMLHTMMCKHQEMPNPAVYKNYVQGQGEENIKMEEHNFYGGNFESAVLTNNPTALEKIKKKIKTD